MTTRTMQSHWFNAESVLLLTAIGYRSADSSTTSLYQHAGTVFYRTIYHKETGPT